MSLDVLRFRGLVTVAVAALVLAACSAGSEDATVVTAVPPAPAPTTAAGVTTEPLPEPTGRADVIEVVPGQVPESPVEDTPSGLTLARGGDVEGLPEPTVALTDLRSGGPPPDGIPPIDAPEFLRTDEVDFLAENEPVLALDLDGDARAYPVQILIWHEIVNDTVAGVPVAVTYCPLCNSAVAYDRRVGDRVVSFGTSGLLWNSALVMYDRQTESLWSHFTGDAIVGVLTGTELETFPVATVPWRVWREAHPDGLVLSRDTGHERSYGSNPYPGYDDITSEPFLFEGEVDGRYTAMTRVVGVEVDGVAVAVPLVSLRDQRVVPAAVGGIELTVWWAPGTASALDAPRVFEGDDIGATGVFEASIDGRLLSFRAGEGTVFVDEQTGSTWNLLGQAIEGALAGRRLGAVEHVDTFWFAWSAFRPDTTIAGGP